MSKRIPVKALKEVSHRYEKDQVIMICWSEKDQRTWVTTYGKTETHCDQACQAGNWLKKHMMNWPESECVAEPSRVSKLKETIKLLKSEVGVT